MEVSIFIEKLENSEICPPKNVHKKMNEWFCNNEVLLTGEVLITKTHNFVEFRGETWFRSNNDYILWSEYKEAFEDLNIDSELVEIEGLKTIQTFRTQDSTEWGSSRSPFEQLIVESCEENKPYLAYVKFYYDHEGNIKPIVAGYTANKTINSSGTDISFSTNVKDGTSRRFLDERGLSYCKTQIAFKCFETKQEALAYELYLQETYNLFGS